MVMAGVLGGWTRTAACLGDSSLSGTQGVEQTAPTLYTKTVNNDTSNNHDPTATAPSRP